MFDYQTSKHAHFDAACRAFAIEHNLEDVAAAVGNRLIIPSARAQCGLFCTHSQTSPDAF